MAQPGLDIQPVQPRTVFQRDRVRLTLLVGRHAGRVALTLGQKVQQVPRIRGATVQPDRGAVFQRPRLAAPLRAVILAGLVAALLPLQALRQAAVESLVLGPERAAQTVAAPEKRRIDDVAVGIGRSPVGVLGVVIIAQPLASQDRADAQRLGRRDIA